MGRCGVVSSVDGDVRVEVVKRVESPVGPDDKGISVALNGGLCMGGDFLQGVGVCVGYLQSNKTNSRHSRQEKAAGFTFSRDVATSPGTVKRGQSLSVGLRSKKGGCSTLFYTGF